MNDDLPVVETSCAEETIAVLLGEVARHSPARALRILIEHLGLEEVRAAAIAEREFEDGDEAPSAEEVAAAAARAEAFNEFATFAHGLLAGVKEPLSEREESR